MSELNVKRLLMEKLRILGIQEMEKKISSVQLLRKEITDLEKEKMVYEGKWSRLAGLEKVATDYGEMPSLSPVSIYEIGLTIAVFVLVVIAGVSKNLILSGLLALLGVGGVLFVLKSIRSNAVKRAQATTIWESFEKKYWQEIELLKAWRGEHINSFESLQILIERKRDLRLLAENNERTIQQKQKELELVHADVRNAFYDLSQKQVEENEWQKEITEWKTCVHSLGEDTQTLKE